MGELNIFVDNKLLEGIRRLAVEHYGDDGEISRKRVVETALEMRLLWSGSVTQGKEEAGEAVSKWEFEESLDTEENGDAMRRWLFRR